MQVNSISNNNFGASINKAAYEIMDSAIQNGLSKSRATEMMKSLEKMADDIRIDFIKPKPGSITGKVYLQVSNKPGVWRSDNSGVEMNISPVVMGKRNVFGKYVEAANLLAQTDFRHNNGIYTIA